MSAAPGLPVDPARLATFRREAAAIVAQERGLTAACRVRLVQAAKNAGLSDEQIDEAIRTLSAAEPEAPPSAAAERFRERLRKDLSVKSRPILGPTKEAKIFSAARRKFGLSEELASVILGEVAAELGVTRITASDAIGSLAAQIDQAAGSSTWMAREAWDRLRSAGTTWGMELEVVDTMIEERLAANRSERRRRQFWMKATLLGTAGSVAAAAVILAGLTIARWQKPTRGWDERPAVAREATVEAPVLSTPAWWDVRLSVDIAAARGRGSVPSDVLGLVGSLRSGERLAGYRKLVEQAAGASQKDVLDDIGRILAGCLALESDDEAALGLQTQVAGLLPVVGEAADGEEAAVERSLWAAQTFAGALERAGASAVRQSELWQSIDEAIGGGAAAGATSEERQRHLRRQTMRAWYARLAAQADETPAAVAQMFPKVAETAEAILDEDALLEAETEFLVAALPAAGEQWRTYERAIGQAISSPDARWALRLVDALRRAKEEELVDHLARLLVVRSGAEPRSDKRKDVVIAVRRALAGQRGLSLADRWLVLEDEVAEAKATQPGADLDVKLAQLVRLSHLTTLAVALAQGETGVVTFDARIESPPPRETRARDRENGSERRPRAGGANGRLSKDQQRELAACLENLGKTTPATKPAREAAWRRLALLAKDAEDIPPAAAGQIAKYALSPQEAGDLTRRLPVLGQLRAWKQFRLAVADRLETANLAEDAMRALVGSLVGALPKAGPTASELRAMLLASVLEELPAEAGLVDGELLDEAGARLAETYFERARLLGASAVSSAASAAELAEQCLRKLANETRVAQQVAAVRHVAAGNQMRQLAGLQLALARAAAERVAARRPERALAGRRLAAECEDAATRAEDLLTQLCDQERTLLEIWMLYAPDA